jgi:uncharacterized protein YciI
VILVLLRYTAEAARIDELRPAHIHWLRTGLADGRLVTAGRRASGDGGMLMVRGSVDDVRDWCARDSYAVAGVADYEFVDVALTMAAPGLGGLLT